MWEGPLCPDPFGSTESRPTSRRVEAQRPLPHLQPHHLANGLHGRAAIRQHRIVVFLEIELGAIARFGLFAHREMLGHADEISRELRRTEPGPFRSEEHTSELQ